MKAMYEPREVTLVRTSFFAASPPQHASHISDERCNPIMRRAPTHFGAGHGADYGTTQPRSKLTFV
jgi:hypothetical protein